MKRIFLQKSFCTANDGKVPSVFDIESALKDEIRQISFGQEVFLAPPADLAFRIGVEESQVVSVYKNLESQNIVSYTPHIGWQILDPVPSSNDFEVPSGLKTVEIPRGILSNLHMRNSHLLLSATMIDPRLLPKNTLAKVFAKAAKEANFADYSDVLGFYPLREQISERLKARGIEAKPEHIMTSVGSQQALEIVCRALLRKSVVTEEPSYYLGKFQMQLNGIEVSGLPIDPFGSVDFEKWETVISAKKPALAYLTSSFQNPTGYSYSTSEMLRILKMSERSGFSILEDDWGSDMLPFSQRATLRSIAGDNVLYMNSFTKKLLPSLRIGYLVANEHSIGALSACKRVSIGSLPQFMEVALSEYLKSGLFDEHLEFLQAELGRRYKNCIDLLQLMMPKDVTWTLPGGGSLLWLRIPDQVNLEKIKTSLLEDKIVIQSAEEAFIDSGRLHGFKIGFAFLSEQEMARCLEALSKALKSKI